MCGEKDLQGICELSDDSKRSLSNSQDGPFIPSKATFASSGQRTGKAGMATYLSSYLTGLKIMPEI